MPYRWRSAITNLTPQRSRFRLLVLTAVVALLAAGCGSIARPEGWAAPAARDGALYLSIEHGKLSAYTINNGSAPQFQWDFPGKDAQIRLVVEGGKNLSTPKSLSPKFEGLYGNPVLTDDSVYVTAYSGHVMAVNRADGQGRWVAELPGRMVGGVLLNNGVVYAGTTSGDLFALDAAAGSVRWSAHPGSEIWAAPVMGDGRIIVATMAGRVSAYNTDGSEQWSRQVADRGIAAHPASSADGRLIVFGSFDRRMYALNAGDGSPVWRSTAADNWFWTQPLIVENTVYAGSLGGVLYAYDLGASGDNTPRWSVTLGSMIRARPTIVSGMVLAATKDGRLWGVKPDDGTRLWDQSPSPAADDPTYPRGDLYADLLNDPTGVYFTTESSRSNSTVYLFNPSDRRVQELRLK